VFVAFGSSRVCSDVRCRGAALLGRVSIDSFDSCAGMRIIRPLRNIMRIECEAALAELAQQQEQQQQPGDAGVELSSVPQSTAVGGAVTCIGDLMKAFVALLQVTRETALFARRRDA
jgi:hypothetical protein